ncbi:MAG: DUF177 domain-containing protein [Pseudomonadota bacterium]
MSGPAPSPFALRVPDLPTRGSRSFELAPKTQEMDQIAQALGLDALRKLRFAGEVATHGKTDWQLTATLGATLVQPCAVTLAPVTTRVDVPVTRLYVSDYTDPDSPEAEMPEDDTIEPLGMWIDPHAVMLEALSLAIPEYPRAEGATLGETVLTEAGKAPLRDADLKPFAGLAALKAQLGDDPNN